MFHQNFYRSLSQEEIETLRTEFNRRMYDVAEARQHHSYNFTTPKLATYDHDIGYLVGLHLKSLGFLSSGHCITLSGEDVSKSYGRYGAALLSKAIKKARNGVLFISDTEQMINPPRNM